MNIKIFFSLIKYSYFRRNISGTFRLSKSKLKIKISANKKKYKEKLKIFKWHKDDDVSFKLKGR